MSREHPDGISEEAIDEVLAEIKTSWLSCPHQRLGQLLVNASSLSGFNGVDLFYIEDSQLLEGLMKI